MTEPSAALQVAALPGLPEIAADSDLLAEIGERLHDGPVWPDGSVDPDPAVQAHRCWEIALGALADLGGTSADVVRTRQLIVDRADAEAVGAVHGEVFGDVRPASTMVVVAGLLDPRWRVEVELDAVVGDAVVD